MPLDASVYCSGYQCYPKRYSLSQPGIPIRIRRASRRGRGGVFDLPMGLGSFHALHPTFLGGFIKYSVSADLALAFPVSQLVLARPTSRDLVPIASSCTGTRTASLFTPTFLGPARQLLKTVSMELEVVRKGIRFPDLTSPFPSGEPRAEAQRRGGVFELAWGGGSMLKSQPLGEIN